MLREKRIVEKIPVSLIPNEHLKPCLQCGNKGGSSHSGRRTLAAKVLANTGRVELVQLLLGHAEVDHVWPYLDVRKEVIRMAFEGAL